VILGIGCDLVEVGRVERQLENDGPGFLEQLFTPDEIAYCEAKRYPARHLSARLAAKEAVFKALALDRSEGFLWRQAEVRSDAAGRPSLVLHGRLRELAEGRGVRSVHVALSHTDTVATANVVLEA
jgi:holo-[acyl-carrier protein] synthase